MPKSTLNGELVRASSEDEEMPVHIRCFGRIIQQDDSSSSVKPADKQPPLPAPRSKTIVNGRLVRAPSEDEEMPVHIRRFGRLIQRDDSSSSVKPADKQPRLPAPQTGHQDVSDDVLKITPRGPGIPTPGGTSVVAPTITPRLQQSLIRDLAYLDDASDTSSFYDGHYKTDAFCFPRAGNTAWEPWSDDDSDSTLDEYHDADDEITEITEEPEYIDPVPTKALFKYPFTGKLLRTNWFKMMFVSGETAEPSVETTTVIEDITREQVLEILSRGTQLAGRRGSRAISTDDLIFLIRHDKAKVSRLRTFLSWKDVRKNVKDSDDKGGADAADFAAADDAAGVVAGPSDVASKPKNKRAKVGLAWDVNSFFSVQVPERDDEEDEEEEEQNYATLQRLAAADERTKNMTKEEYVFWSECRQASFTYRKSKRFREWAGFGIVTESKPNDDIVDILGFLTFEIVQTLTEKALKVKEREDHEKNRGGADTSSANKKRKRETGLFDPPEEGRTPIEPRHIREAYRKLQASPQKAIAMLLHNGRVPAKLPLQLI